MSDLYKINPDIDIPIYQQLVDLIRANVKSGKMAPGSQLPTVREMAADLGIAAGTIKRAYDELERLSIVEKIRGRGTFVSYHRADSDSRKDRAMAAIDEMLDSLAALDFSMTETEIFINLKLREREAHRDNVKTALIVRDPEILSQLSDRLHAAGSIDIYSFLLDDVKEYPYKLSEDMDIIITTPENYTGLCDIVSQKDKVSVAAIQLSEASLTRIIKVPHGSTVGILSASEGFGEKILDVCENYMDDVNISRPALFDDTESVISYLKGKDQILVPDGYEKYCSEPMLDALREYSSEFNLIYCSYRIDKGSAIYLKERIMSLLESKKI